MATTRTWRREARLLLAVAELAQAGRAAAIEDVLALDFLMQHPSVLTAFAELGDEPWPAWSLPSVAEAQSSEEALLRWKRSAGASLVAPLLGRLVGRGLVTQAARGVLVVTDVGRVVGDRLRGAVSDEERERLALAAGEFAGDPAGARDRLRRSLEGQAA